MLWPRSGFSSHALLMDALKAFPGGISPRPPHRQAGGGAGSEPVRLAGFRGLHPVVPDRSAFGAAIEQKPHGDDARNPYHPTQHERTTPLNRDHGPQV